MTSVDFSEGTVMVKLPSKSVAAAVEVPFTVTVAPITGSCCSSITRPVTLIWANDINAAMRNVANHIFLNPELLGCFIKECYLRLILFMANLAIKRHPLSSPGGKVSRKVNCIFYNQSFN